MKEMWDGTGKIVEIKLSDDAHTLWVNIDSSCALRCTRIEKCHVELPAGTKYEGYIIEEKLGG